MKKEIIYSSEKKSITVITETGQTFGCCGPVALQIAKHIAEDDKATLQSIKETQNNYIQHTNKIKN